MIKSAARLLTRRGAFRCTLPTSVRSFSSFSEKERGEEARYFARDDAEKVAAMKAKFEAVVSKGDAEELDELMDVLGMCTIAAYCGYVWFIVLQITNSHFILCSFCFNLGKNRG